MWLPATVDLEWKAFGESGGQAGSGTEKNDDEGGLGDDDGVLGKGKGLFAFASFGFDDSGCMMHPRDTQSLTTTYIYGWIHEGGIRTRIYINLFSLLVMFC